MSALSQIARRIDKLNAPEPVKHPLRVLHVLARDMTRCDLMKQASAMAYVTLLSLIPSLVAIFCVLSLFSPLMGSGTNLTDQIKDWILQNLAADTGETAVHYLEGMLGNLSLAKIGWSSFASVLVTLILLLRQIELALNRIWLVHKGRNVFTRFMYFWTFLTLGLVVLAIGFGVSAGFDVRSLFGDQAPEVTAGAKALGAMVSFGGAFLFFFFLYKVVPNCSVRGKSAAAGAVTASILLIEGGRIYAMYVKDAKHYATLYGALAQLPLFLTWLYICWIIILLGALVSWRTQEGFPKEEAEETLDAANTPLEKLRNVEVQAAMPLIVLIAIHQHFQEGSGRGLSGQELAHALRLPTAWVSEALEALEAMGYVVAGKAGAGDHAEVGSVTDPFFPASPAHAVALGKLRGDLAGPMTEWMAHWHHELPIDLRRAVDELSRTPASKTLAEAMAMLPATAV